MYDGPDEEEEAETMGKTQHEEGEEPEFEEEETGERGFDNGMLPEEGGDAFEDYIFFSFFQTLSLLFLDGYFF